MQTAMGHFMYVWLCSISTEFYKETYVYIVAQESINGMGQPCEAIWLSPIRCQAITPTTFNSLPIKPQGTYLNEILVDIKKVFI